MSTLTEIKDHNGPILYEIKATERAIENQEGKLVLLKQMLKAPCEFCPYDGEYRCEACVEANYE